MDKIQAIQSFWSSFGLPAYDNSTVPDDAEMPYITYELNIGDYGEDVATTASVWYYGKSWKPIEEKMKEIDEVFNNGGININYDDGNIWLKKGTPYRMRIADENDMVRRYVINVMIEYH